LPSKKFYQEHREEILRKLRDRYANDEKFRRDVIRRSVKSQSKCREKARARRKRWRDKNKEYIHKHNKEYRDNIRFMLYAGYSNGQPKCACCGENRFEFLTIDHIDGEGVRYGKGKKLKTSYQFYNWLIKSDFPDGYQVLCYNCNSSLGHYGYCPHEMERKFSE